MLAGLLLVQRLDLLHQRVDFVAAKFSAVLRHVTLAIRDDLAQVIRRSARRFCGSERWPAEVASLRGLSMALCAVLGVNGICSQSRIGLWCLRQRQPECQQQRTTSDREFKFHVSLCWN